MNTLKKDWSIDVTIKHILSVIRCLLIVPFPESSLNDEAGKLFMDSYEEFSKRARIMTEVHAVTIDTDNEENVHTTTTSGQGSGSSNNSSPTNHNITKTIPSFSSSSTSSSTTVVKDSTNKENGSSTNNTSTTTTHNNTTHSSNSDIHGTSDEGLIMNKKKDIKKKNLKRL